MDFYGNGTDEKIIIIFLPLIVNKTFRHSIIVFTGDGRKP
jgi:hypothetical protein